MPEAVTGVYKVYGEIVREGYRTKGFLAIDWLNTKETNLPNMQIVCSMDWQLVTEVMINSIEN